MERQKTFENSYCIMRIREVLEEKDEKEKFEEALENVLRVYYSTFNKVENNSSFEELYSSEENKLFECLDDILVICNIAKKRSIYLDRPNDKLSYFIYSISKYFLR